MRLRPSSSGVWRDSSPAVARVLRYLWRGMVAATLVAWPSLAQAELYVYEGPDGVIHFTNIDPHRKKPVKDRSNTFHYNNEAGDLRRIHRVDVADYDEVIEAAAAYYSLPAALVKAVIAAESAFEPQAVSHAGAQGLMQLIPKTAAAMHVRDVFSPKENIYGGVRYLRVLANEFGGDLRLTLAAYNAGPNAVKKHQGVPPFAETQTYVSRVLTFYRHYLEHWRAR